MIKNINNGCIFKSFKILFYCSVYFYSFDRFNSIYAHLLFKLLLKHNWVKKYV